MRSRKKIAEAVAFLAGPRALINCQVIRIDGCFTIFLG
jgi:hypothetical protein